MLSSISRALASLALAAAASARVSAADYYVSPAGDDAGAGTATAPWRSIDRVNRHALRPGDRMLFQGSAEFAGNLVLASPESPTDAANPIVVGSYGRGRAVIRAGRGTGIRIEDLGGVVVRDLVVVGDPRVGNEGFGVLVLHRRPDPERLEGVRIDDVEARGFRWAGIYVGGVPTDLPGFDAPMESRFGFSGVRIRRCVARNNVYHGIYVDGAAKGSGANGYANRDVVIVDCVAADNPGDPHYTAKHSGNGILIGDTDEGLIEHCVAHGNGAANAGRPGGPVGIWTYASNRVTIRSSESYGNRTGGHADGGGFDLDGGVTNSVIEYCYSHDNDGPGFLIWNYEGAPHRLAGNILRYNISAVDSRKHRYGGISVGTSDAPIHDLLVHNNTVFATRVGVDEPSCVRVWEHSGDGLRFVNNLFVTSGGVPAIACEMRGDGVCFVGNAYWAADGAFQIRHGERFDDLTAWRAATGQERWRGRDVGIYADPRLDGASTSGAGQPPSPLGQFRLRTGSPLIDAGLDLVGFSDHGPGDRDFRGTTIPKGRGPDVGANEFDPSGR
jgi:hypothetical protein